jgi:hypothetical protein
VDELLAAARDGRPSQLDDHKEYLHQRWNAGCTSVRQLHAEIRQRGYPGAYSTLRDYLQPFRELGAALPAAPAPPKARDITRWLPTQPDSLDEDEKAKLKDARDRCPHVDALASHVTAFAEILTGRHGDRLDDWIAAVEADDQPDLHSFTLGIRRDYDAVKNGLTLPWSSGAVEGNVNRLKDGQAPDVRPRRPATAPQARPADRQALTATAPTAGPGAGRVAAGVRQRRGPGGGRGVPAPGGGWPGGGHDAEPALAAGPGAGRAGP